MIDSAPPWTPITIAEARTVARATLAWGREHGSGPLTAAVLDTGGHVVVLERDDGSEFLRVDVAIAKAWGAIGMGLPSRVMGERAQHIPQFFSSLTSVAGGRLVPVPGGVLIRREGRLIGAAGVSGDTSTVDEEAAVAAIEAAGLQPDFGQIEEWRRP
jgi:uncharacterized protein GlcG (DUF336 family)